MPLKLTVNLSRKVGEANYGSRGASVGLELEMEASLVQRPEEFQEQVADLFRLARDSVDRELARPSAAAERGVAANGTVASPPRTLRAATVNQIRALHALSAAQDVNLRTELLQRFGVAQPADLSLGQASALIASLQSTATGNDKHEPLSVAQSD